MPGLGTRFPGRWRRLAGDRRASASRRDDCGRDVSSRGESSRVRPDLRRFGVRWRHLGENRRVSALRGGDSPSDEASAGESSAWLRPLRRFGHRRRHLGANRRASASRCAASPRDGISSRCASSTSEVLASHVLATRCRQQIKCSRSATPHAPGHPCPAARLTPSCRDASPAARGTRARPRASAGRSWRTAAANP